MLSGWTGHCVPPRLGSLQGRGCRTFGKLMALPPCPGWRHAPSPPRGPSEGWSLQAPYLMPFNSPWETSNPSAHSPAQASGLEASRPHPVPSLAGWMGVPCPQEAAVCKEETKLPRGADSVPVEKRASHSHASLSPSLAFSRIPVKYTIKYI